MSSTRSRILVALRSLARPTDPKLAVADDIARALDADVALLHVVRPSASEAAARAYLDTLAVRLRNQGVHAEVAVASGEPEKVILEHARTARMLVMGSSAQRGLLSAVRGSVAERIVHAGGCPVVLVQPTSGGWVEPELHSFTAAVQRSGPLWRLPSKRQTVEVARVVGSVDRATELGADFRPSSSEWRRDDEQRFQRVLAAMERGNSLPAVELYQLGYGYYIMDGHHRIAAARQLGQLDIDANVVEFVCHAQPRASN